MTTAKVERITPEVAKAMLDKNVCNRPVNKFNVKFLVKEITEGNWQFNGDTIRIADDGSLLDGQHRLLAIVEAGTSLDVIVVRGLPTKVFPTIDTGKRRSGADTLSMEGVKNSRLVAAALVTAHYIETTGTPTHPWGRSVSNSEVLALFRRHPGLLPCVAVVGPSTKKWMPGSLAVALCYAFGRAASRDKAAEFFGKLESGEDMSSLDSILCLRNRLIANLTNPAKLTPVVIAAIAVKAWNAFIGGYSVKSLKWAQDLEDFPKIKGPRAV